MQPLRKPFFGDPLFPFEIAYKTVKKRYNELPNHLHERYELVYIHQGKGTFFINNTLYEKNPGDLFVIPGNTLHHALPDRDEPIMSTALYFAPALLTTGSLDDSYSHLLCYELARRGKVYKFTLPGQLRSITETVLKQINEEMTLQHLGYRDAVRLLTCQLLLHINRISRLDQRSIAEDSRVGPHWIREALRIIDEHPERHVGLAMLADKANVSPPHFSRVFKQLTAMNVTDYVNAKRIIRAKELLLQSEDKISVIAERCGFDTTAHFHRTFKALTGTTPKEYRKSQKIKIEPFPSA
ncbi:helix-turn-helix domain-containing protein [Paenibacillus fonticola]|uniref:helix-turn-helix domain-containing protein n=1 Tax=Paenibacillus fonticola TaxID=379896 RepID=UPI00037093F0|nr:helix-turn-helix domain-containing protein [Paenibacillus fonticola]